MDKSDAPQSKLTNSLRELVRYGIVGLGLNAIGYSLYLFITYVGVEPNLAVAILYPVAVIIGFFGHKKVSFQYKGGQTDVPLLSKYIFAYAVGYVLNLVLLEIGHYQLGYAHELVQGCCVFILAAFLFVMQKFFVFRDFGEEVSD